MLGLLLVLDLIVGCAAQQRQAQKVVASSFAVAANDVGDVLQRAYAQEGLDAIAKAKTRQDAEASLDQIRAKWRPVWAALDKVRAAQNVWATALERGDDLDRVNDAARGVIGAYCALEGAAKPLVALPAAPGVSCPEVSP
jgi:hypothetical protein